MPDGTGPKRIQFFVVVALLALTALVLPSAAASAITLEISEPKHGDDPVYVNFRTEFSLSGADEMWYRWSEHDYTLYTEPFHAVVAIGTSGGAPGLPEDLSGLQTLYYNAPGEAPKSIRVFVDNYYPDTVASIIGANYTGDHRYITPETGIKLSASDSGSGVAGTYYKVGDGDFALYHSPFKVAGTGAKIVYYYSTDNLDNKEPHRELAVFVDREPPAVEIVPGDPNVRISDSIFLGPTTLVSITATDATGISSTSYRIDGGSWIPYSVPFTLSGEGQHIIAARATDNLGQQSGETTLVVQVDGTAPNVYVVGHDPPTLRARAGDLIELECSDAGAGGCVIHYSLDGGQNWDVYTSPVMILTGDTELRYYAVDALGNSAEVSVMDITVGESRPWTFYASIALIMAAVCILIITFFPFGRKPVNETPKAPKARAGEKRTERGDTGPKRRKRNY